MKRFSTQLWWSLDFRSFLELVDVSITHLIFSLFRRFYCFNNKLIITKMAFIIVDNTISYLFVGGGGLGYCCLQLAELILLFILCKFNQN